MALFIRSRANLDGFGWETEHLDPAEHHSGLVGSLDPPQWVRTPTCRERGTRREEVVLARGSWSGRGSLRTAWSRPAPSPWTCLSLRGSFSEVFMVREKKTGNLYALKCLKKKFLANSNLENEINVLRK